MDEKNHPELQSMGRGYTRDSPAFVVNGNAEVVRAEHAMALARALPRAQLAILPGEHGEYIGEIFAADKTSKIPALPTAMIEAFLKR